MQNKTGGIVCGLVIGDVIGVVTGVQPWRRYSSLFSHTDTVSKRAGCVAGPVSERIQIFAVGPMDCHMDRKR